MRPSRRQMPPFTRAWSNGRLTVTAVLIAMHVGAFAAQSLFDLLEADRLIDTGWITQCLALSRSGIVAGNVWQFLTASFVHQGPYPFHLIGSMLLLFFAGREVEPIVGPRHFLGIYALGMIVGGAAHVLTFDEPMLGSCAGVAAMIAAYATILPELEVTFSLFFVLPIRLKAKHLGIALLVVAGSLWLSLTTPTIGPSAMIAAAITGWLYVKQLGYGNPLAIQRFLFEKRQRAARLQRMSAEQFINFEIDPILDKISRDGMHSLTRKERRILEQGREKIAAKSSRK